MGLTIAHFPFCLSSVLTLEPEEDRMPLPHWTDRQPVRTPELTTSFMSFLLN